MSIKNNVVTRTFTNQKLVESRLLNRLGLQVARTYGARLAYNMRPSRSEAEIADWLTTLKRDGMVVIKNFVPEDSYQQLKQKCLGLLHDHADRLSHKEHGPTRYAMAAIKDFDDLALPEIDSFFKDSRLKGLMEAAEKRPLDLARSHRAVEWVRQGTTSTEGDPETVLHSDIFFHTHKAWLYLTDVTPASAPIVFVKGSHRLNRIQAGEIYRHSCNPETPSRRIHLRELERLGLKEEALECAENTLVIANVCGYHRRSVGQPGGERIALHCSVRSQPFAFWKNK